MRRLSFTVRGLLAALMLCACGQSGGPVVSKTRGAEPPAPPSAEAPLAVSPSTPPVPAPEPPAPQPAPEPPAPAPVPAAAGDYSFPLSPASVARYGRSHHDYPATDIFAPCGTPVVAVTSGVIHEVSRTDTWSSANDDPAIRGGLSTSLVGDDGVRYYGSHLSAVAPGIEPGVRVEKGRQIGAVGDTGNARGSGCHLHFGISPPCGPGDWQVRRGTLYPWPYLDSWRSGGTRSPAGEIGSC
jgi:peptidoglycan LD-endopeptidase LytH